MALHAEPGQDLSVERPGVPVFPGVGMSCFRPRGVFGLPLPFGLPDHAPEVRRRFFQLSQRLLVKDFFLPDAGQQHRLVPLSGLQFSFLGLNGAPAVEKLRLLISDLRLAERQRIQCRSIFQHDRLVPLGYQGKILDASQRIAAFIEGEEGCRISVPLHLIQSPQTAGIHLFHAGQFPADMGMVLFNLPELQFGLAQLFSPLGKLGPSRLHLAINAVKIAQDRTLFFIDPLELPFLFAHLAVEPLQFFLARGGFIGCKSAAGADEKSEEYEKKRDPLHQQVLSMTTVREKEVFRPGKRTRQSMPRIMPAFPATLRPGSFEELSYRHLSSDQTEQTAA